ncbi:hypothetical protein SEVIR_1G114251v4 [Setaria viridis]
MELKGLMKLSIIPQEPTLFRGKCKEQRSSSRSAHRLGYLGGFRQELAVIMEWPVAGFPQSYLGLPLSAGKKDECQRPGRARHQGGTRLPAVLRGASQARC